MTLLLSGSVDDDLEEGHGKDKVRKNLKKAGFDVLRCDKGPFDIHYDELVPGEVQQVYLEAKDDTSQITASFTNITPSLPPVDQNVFFGDDLFVIIQDAITSDEDTVGFGYLWADTVMTVDNPQTGIVRIAAMGDWTNAGDVSANLNIVCTETDEGEETAEGEVAQSEVDVVVVQMPAGVAHAVFELSWENNWGRFPTDDIDMILTDPNGTVFFDGATLNSPERVEVFSPIGGAWTVSIDGFTVWGDDDDDDDHDDDHDKKHKKDKDDKHDKDKHDEDSEWELRVTADGVRVEGSDDEEDDDD